MSTRRYRVGRAKRPGAARVSTRGLAAACFGLGLSVALVGAAPGSVTGRAHGTGTSNGGAAKPDFSYFAGKTITFISPSAPGGSNDDLARLMAPLMASYLHCNVEIEDNSAGADIAGQDQVAAAAPNGLTIGEMIPPTIVDDAAVGIEGVDFPIQKVPVIAGTPDTGGMIIVQPSFPIKTFSELVRSKATFPMLVPGLDAPYAEIKLFLLAYGVHADYVSGYANGAAIAAGFVRGDAPMAIMGYSALQSLIVGGRARAIIQGAQIAPGTIGYDIMRKVPTFAQFSTTDPPKTAFGRAAVAEAIGLNNLPVDVIFAPAGTPAPILAALRDAARSALAQQSLRTTGIAEGLDPDYISPTATEAAIHYGVTHESTLGRYLSR